MIIPLQRDEARVRDHRRHSPALVESDHRIVAAMQHQRRDSDLWQQLGDVGLVVARADPGGVLR